MYEHNALGYWLGLALCLTKVRSSRACCPATALISRCGSCYAVQMINYAVSVLLICFEFQVHSPGWLIITNIECLSFGFILTSFISK